jgi:hypothetical protein
VGKSGFPYSCIMSQLRKYLGILLLRVLDVHLIATANSERATPKGAWDGRFSVGFQVGSVLDFRSVQCRVAGCSALGSNGWTKRSVDATYANVIEVGAAP